MAGYEHRRRYEDRTAQWVTLADDRSIRCVLGAVAVRGAVIGCCKPAGRRDANRTALWATLTGEFSTALVLRWELRWDWTLP